MSITLDISQLKTLLRDAAELGCANYVKKMCPNKDTISQREAYRLYGKSRVMLWLEEGQISTMRNGDAINSKLLYSKAELMAADKNERMLYQIGR